MTMKKRRRFQLYRNVTASDRIILHAAARRKKSMFGMTTEPVLSQARTKTVLAWGTDEHLTALNWLLERPDQRQPTLQTLWQFLRIRTAESAYAISTTVVLTLYLLFTTYLELGSTVLFALSVRLLGFIALFAFTLISTRSFLPIEMRERFERVGATVRHGDQITILSRAPTRIPRAIEHLILPVCIIGPPLVYLFTWDAKLVLGATVIAICFVFIADTLVNLWCERNRWATYQDGLLINDNRRYHYGYAFKRDDLLRVVSTPSGMRVMSRKNEYNIDLACSDAARAAFVNWVNDAIEKGRHA